MIYILVVLYNKSVDSSDTLQGLLLSSEYLKSINAAILLWDNSPFPLHQKEINLLKGKLELEYYHASDNKPLSFVYNTVINKMLTVEKYSHLILLDDDSSISVDYFIEVAKTIRLHSSLPILVPVVTNHNQIISPAKFYYVKGSYFKTISPGIYAGHLFAINSGMVIARSFMEKYDFRYDNRLKNYGTDNYIMNFVNKHNTYCYVLNYRFEHNLSLFDHPDITRKLEIFRQIKQANKIVFSSNLFESVMIHCYNFASSLKHAIKYKSLRFFS